MRVLQVFNPARSALSAVNGFCCAVNIVLLRKNYANREDFVGQVIRLVPRLVAAQSRYGKSVRICCLCGWVDNLCAHTLEHKTRLRQTFDAAIDVKARK